MSRSSYRTLRDDEETQPFKLKDKRPVPEEGLSVDPDQLGEQFLVEATEQDNFESEVEPQLSLQEGADSDEPRPDENGTVWERTIRRVPQSGVRAIRDVAIADDPEAEPDVEDR